MFCSNLDAYRHETNLLLRRKKTVVILCCGNLTMLKVGFEVKASTTHQHLPQRKGRLFSWVFERLFFSNTSCGGLNPWVIQLLCNKLTPLFLPQGYSKTCKSLKAKTHRIHRIFQKDYLVIDPIINFSFRQAIFCWKISWQPLELCFFSKMEVV